MIKTIPLDLTISFFLGLVFALTAAPLLEKEEAFINTYFVRAVLFQVLVFIPFGLFLAWRWTAWSWMYLINPGNHSRWWTLGAVLAYLPAMVAGFHIAYSLIRLGKRNQIYWYLIASGLAIVLISVGMFGRLYHVQDSWLPPSRIHEAPSWFNFWFMLTMTVGGAYFFLALSYILRLNRADRRRMAREAFSKPLDG